MNLIDISEDTFTQKVRVTTINMNEDTFTQKKVLVTTRHKHFITEIFSKAANDITLAITII